MGDGGKGTSVNLDGILVVLQRAASLASDTPDKSWRLLKQKVEEVMWEEGRAG